MRFLVAALGIALIIWACRSYERGRRKGYHEAHMDLAGAVKQVREMQTATQLIIQVSGKTPAEIAKLVASVKRQREAAPRQ